MSALQSGSAVSAGSSVGDAADLAPGAHSSCAYCFQVIRPNDPARAIVSGSRALLCGFVHVVHCSDQYLMLADALGLDRRLVDLG